VAIGFMTLDGIMFLGFFFYTESLFAVLSDGSVCIDTAFFA